MPFGKPPKGAGLRVLVPDVDAAVSIGVGTPGVGTPLTAASSLPVTPLEPGREPSVRCVVLFGWVCWVVEQRAVHTFVLLGKPQNEVASGC